MGYKGDSRVTIYRFFLTDCVLSIFASYNEMVFTIIIPLHGIQEYYHFTEPAVNASITLFWKMTNTRTIGMIAITTPANSAP